MPGMDREFEKKFDTTKLSAEELKMCKEEARVPPGRDQELKKKFGTTKMSAEELKMCKEEAKRPMGMDRESEKKVDTTNVSPEELKMLNPENARRPPAMEQELKKTFDVTMMSPEELKVLNLEDARRTPGQGFIGPGATLHHQGGPALSKAGRYPVVLAGVAVLTGISTFLYYRTVSVKQLQGKADEVMDSIRPGTAKTTADATR